MDERGTTSDERPARRAWRVALPTLIACCAVVSTPAWGERPGQEPAALTARTLRGGGAWERESRARPGRAERWEIDVTRADDGALAGTVTLGGSPLMARGTLRGTIEGRRVTGRIATADGIHVADFVGRVGGDGALRGTYQDRTGEVGRWHWDGPLPR